MKSDKNSQYLFYYYSEGIGSKQFEEVTLDDLAGIIANPLIQATIDELKARYANSDLTEKQIKQKLATLFPAYVVGGCIRFAKKGEGKRVKLRVPVIFIDIDKIRVKDGEPRRLTQQEASDLRDDIAERCPHWLLVYTSQSDCGVHALLNPWITPSTTIDYVAREGFLYPLCHFLMDKLELIVVGRNLPQLEQSMHPTITLRSVD